MLDGLGTALTLAALMSKIPLMSLAVIAAIAVLVYEVRSFFGRSARDAPLSPAADGVTPMAVPPERPRPLGADRLSVLRAEAPPLGERESSPPPERETAPAALPFGRGEVMTAASRSGPARAQVVRPRRVLTPASREGIGGRLALAGAIAGVALLWLAVRSRRGRAHD